MTMTVKHWLTLCLLALSTLFMSNIHAANLTASVDRDTIGLQETFTLTLRYDDQINATPDYSLLQRDFDILNTQSGTSVSLVNGHAEAFTEWKIALAPKKIGTFLIPSFNIDGAVSDAIQMTIEGKSRGPQNTTDKISVETEVSKDTAYVQEQIMVTVRLFTRVSLSHAEMDPLQIKDALIVQMEDKQYQTQINGEPGLVVETRYAVFPQKSGELIIPSLTYQVTMSDGQRDIWSRLYGNNRNNLLRLRTEEQRVQVNPAPQDQRAQPWLPAKNLRIEEHWSASTDSIKVGEPVTRTISIIGEGLTAGQLAPLSLPDIDGLTLYQDKAQTDEQKNDEGVTGTRIETTAVVANRAGRFTMPEIKINWWDTQNKEFKTATLPAAHLNVSGLPGDVTSAASDTNDSVAEQSVPLNTDVTSLPQTGEKNAISEVPLWLYITQAISVLLLVWLGFAYLNLRKKLAAIAYDQREPQLIEHENERQAWNQLKTAFAQRNLPAIRTAILHWARAQSPERQIHRLSDIDANGDGELFAALAQLDAAIYSSSQAAPDTEKLFELLGQHRRAGKNITALPRLAPLYRN